ncbi:hypothetical protein ACC637_002097 [Pseudomonas aeruginosa]|uniref:hypothetical protein n=1 Tax=Pseudomonas aeruginosa TaxID=287 RepID=UPI0015F02A65|nr:hypothetical protein [Pseudomonas aeruginosa]MBA5068635.1 hypothetical protein [Pseudomonas aeruginosa]MDJ1409035.1 hypothetical protein [Pseudomonas aeruginosa]HCE6448025.1 hypothetical protein [Pseudomonas aeruginosa]HCE6613469.1 hypothetical protein [Pseudomonas aeruginosa]
MKIDQITIGLDWLHARLPAFTRRMFLVAATLLSLGLAHVVASTLIDGYRDVVLAGYARAEAERSILALPLGHLLGSLGVLVFWLWVATILLRAFLSLRARLWRRAGQ